jgi:hypothetical protein
MPTGQKGQGPEFCLWSKMNKVHVLHATIMIVHRGLLNRFMSTLAPTATERSRCRSNLIITLFVVNANGVKIATAVNSENASRVN